MSKLQNLKILDLLHVAKQHIQYPKIRLKMPDSNVFGESRFSGSDLVLQLAGANAKKPGTVNITDGKPYGSNKWYGRILRSGEFEFAKSITTTDMQNISDTFKLFSDDPVNYAELYGKGTGNCMFCGRQLTDPQSIAVGYGPVCAEHYALPHGEMDKQVANDLSQVELSFDAITPNSNEKIPLAAYSGLAICCEEMLSDMQYADLQQLLQKYPEDVRTKYNLMVTALWEHTI